MDITSLLGPLVSLGFIIVGLIMEGGHVESILQVTAAIIVLGGAFGAIMVGYSMKDMIFGFKSIGTWLKKPAADPDDILAAILDCADTARKESILALEKKRDTIEYPPLAKAIKLAVDGTDPQVIRETLETEQFVVAEEAEVGVKFWEHFGAIAPTIGILGAVLGLIHVMENLDKPEMIGPGIAIAFVATLYGVGFANIFAIPIGVKLKRKVDLDSHTREMVIIGVDGILNGLNPAVIKEKLAVFSHHDPEDGG